MNIIVESERRPLLVSAGLELQLLERWDGYDGPGEDWGPIGFTIQPAAWTYSNFRAGWRPIKSDEFVAPVFATGDGASPFLCVGSKEAGWRFVVAHRETVDVFELGASPRGLQLAALLKGWQEMCNPDADFGLAARFFGLSDSEQLLDALNALEEDGPVLWKRSFEALRTLVGVTP